MNGKLKESYRNIFRLFPSYRCLYKQLCNGVEKDGELERSVRRAIRKSIFYNSYSRYVNNGFDIQSIPIIRKTDIVGHESDMVSSGFSKKFLRHVTTGGTTGHSLNLSRSWKDSLKEAAFSNYCRAKIGDNLVVGVLRGDKPQGGLCEIQSKRRIILSSFMLNSDTLDEYLKIINKYKISCIHAYPSSLVVLARLIKLKYGTAHLPMLKGFLTSSEIFSKESKQLVRSVFPDATIVDFYGHSEMACCAYCVNDGFYHFFEQYGHVDFVDTGNFLNGNQICEIVATSVMNKTMPFIRYATDDYAEIDKQGNVVSIIGRTSDFLINKKGEITPCIFSSRSESFEHVGNFQYYQDRIGTMVFRIVAAPGFNDIEKRYLQEDLDMSFNGTMDCSVEILNELERTSIGKIPRLVQKLDVKSYMN